MSESQGNNSLNQASSNMPVLGAAPTTNSGVGQAPIGAAMPQMATRNQSAPQSAATIASAQAPTAVPQPRPTSAAPQPQAVQSTTAPVAAAASAQPRPTAAQPQASASPQPAAKPVAAAHPQPAPTSRDVDFFAEQNARNAEKKAKNAKIIKRIAIIGGLILALAIAGIVAWFVIKGGDQSGKLTMEDINNLRFTFADIYSETNSLDDVRNRYNQILNTEIGRENADQVKLQLMFFYMNNGFAARAVEVGETVDLAKLNNESQSAYYNQMYNAYLNTGDWDKASAAQFESAMLIGERLDGDASDNNNSGDGSGDNGDSGSSGDNDASQGDQTPEQQYTCDGETFFSFPVACEVNGEEPNEF